MENRYAKFRKLGAFATGAVSRPAVKKESTESLTTSDGEEAVHTKKERKREHK